MSSIRVHALFQRVDGARLDIAALADDEFDGFSVSVARNALLDVVVIAVQEDDHVRVLLDYRTRAGRT